MIKELIFSGKKYWQSDIQPLVGKTIKIPSAVTTYGPMQASASGQTVGMISSSQGGPYPQGIKIIGEMIAPTWGSSEEQYFICLADSDMRWYSLSQILATGGVSSSPLTHLYQAFKRAFTRNEAIACL